MNYNPLQYGAMRANIRGQTVSGIQSSVTRVAKGIENIVQRKDAEKQMQLIYQQALKNFVDQVKEINPDLSKGDARILATRAYRPPVPQLGVETNLNNLVAADSTAQNLLKQLRDTVAQQEAKGFSQKMTQPVTESRQVQAEGPPIPPPTGMGPSQVPQERIGEIPMERQISSRPVRSSEYEEQFQQLTPEAQKYVPESTKEQVTSAEQTYQQPLKTFEEERDKEIEERETNIKTMTGIDKSAGFYTAISESQHSVEGLNTKKKAVNDLAKINSKMDTLPPKQIENGRQTELQREADQIAEQLNIPAQLVFDPEFLGRMNAEIDRLIAKEQQQQKLWEISLKDLQKREDEKVRLKNIPKPKTATPVPAWKTEKELRLAIDDFAKKQFPSFFKVINGEYGIEMTKQLNGVANAGISITRDPKKRIALAYAFPEEFEELLRVNKAPRPSEDEIQSVRDELNNLQNQIYEVINTGSPSSSSSPSSSENNPLGISMD
jgi:hypothetical protein